MRIDPVPEVFAPLAGVESHSVQVETVAVQPAASSTSTPERTSWALNEFVYGRARTKWARMGWFFSRPGLRQACCRVKGFATGAQANRRREGSCDPGRLDRCQGRYHEARGCPRGRRADRAADQGGDDGLGVGRRGNRLEVRRASHRSSAAGRSDRCLEAGVDRGRVKT